MTIANILVPVRGDGKGEHVLDHAMLIARAFRAHIDAVHCRARPQDMVPFGVVVPSFLREQIEASMSQVTGGEEERLHALFDDMVARNGMEIVPGSDVPPRDRATITWHQETGRQAEMLGRRGRLADLIAVPKPDRERNLGANSLYSALMETGRPVMMCPDRPVVGNPLGHIAVAWNGSTEAARAIAAGNDLLAEAERVTVMTAGSITGGPSADSLRAYLAIRGVSSGFAQVPTDREIGEALLGTVREIGADMLLMGAYSHSRGRESLLGGASQHIVDHASLPVVLMH